MSSWHPPSGRTLVFRSSLLSLVSLAFLGCAPSEPEDVSESDALPLAGGPSIPALLRDVHLTDGCDSAADNDYTYPVVPPFRTSADGRIGVDMKKRPSSELFLLTPEKLQAPLLAPGAPAGAEISDQKVILSATDYYNLASYGQAYINIDPEHRTICDPTPQFAYGANTVLNPHPCNPADPKYADPAGTTDVQDCYNLTMITSVQVTELATATRKVQLWSKPFAVVVDNPKRWASGGAQAHISQIDTYPGNAAKAAVAGPMFYANSVLEPMVTNDGRLLVGRLGKSTRDPNTGASRNGDVLDVIYSTYSEQYAPCDVTKWTNIHPISHAYADNDMIGRYGLAAYQLRDPQGTPINDGDDAQVSYPWVDRAGSNLFFTMMDTTLYNNVGGSISPRYTASCYQAGCPIPPAAVSDFEDDNNFRGVGFAGLWSHGKMVLLDSVINNVDYGLGRDDIDQVYLDLYVPSTNPDPAGDQTGLVRTGTGRDNGVPRPHPNTTENSSFIDSFEQLFNYDDDLRPLTVRDVVWTMNTGRVSADLAFDDYLDPDAVILAEMSGALAHRGPGGRTMRYEEGFDPSGLAEEVRFQNAATSLAWTVPDFGRGTGNVRVEPVALGGIEGKGAWLDGSGDAVTFDMDLPGYQDRAWYIGVFLDPRFSTPGRRQLIVFPNGGEVILNGLTTLELKNGLGVTTASIALGDLSPVMGKFTHFGFVLDYPNNRIEVYINGYGVAIPTGSPLKLTTGTLYLGDKPGDARAGVIGWVDELKLLAHHPGAEVICNHARGTLMGADNATSEPWISMRDDYPQWVHDQISARLTTLGHGASAQTKYVCHHDYSNPVLASPRLEPDTGLTPMRDLLLFPEGPLEFNVERPDSSLNTFCLSCHHTAGEHGLGLTALDPGAPGVELQNDERRQPMMAPRVMFGNVPAYLFGTGPAFDLHTGDHCIDRYEHPTLPP